MSVLPVWDPPLPLAIGALPTLRGAAGGRLGHRAPTGRAEGPLSAHRDRLRDLKLMISYPISVFRLVRLVISALV
ncbi:hypothetical protein Pen02_11810 [Plantactinospora endophytica]|uniref:Uncharacterized protein n=1 Tax=Plantactinospora endophytica TaxID=673535 RepID=A0ABQ4DUW8_9ACTN|nr:hypothetical protein Pen02_11810 [Plantactinospora endophytica]